MGGAHGRGECQGGSRDSLAPAERKHGEGIWVSRRLAAAVQWIDDRLDRPTSRRAQRILLGVAALVFLGGGLVALSRLEVEAARIAWLPLVLALVVGVPLTAAANAAEYAVTARVAGYRVALRSALRVSVLSTAANMLPLPGSALVRIRGIREEGSGYGAATSATAAVGLTWIGISAGLAGAWLVAGGAGARGLPLLATGAGALGVAWALLAHGLRDPRRRVLLAGAAVGVEILSVATGALRIVLVLAGLDLPATVTGGLVLAVSGSLSAVAGIFPAGLGLRELIASGLAPLAGLPPSAGFAATAVDRVLGILGHAPLTAVLATGRGTTRDGSLTTSPRGEGAMDPEGGAHPGRRG